jgi:membrane-associated phospholipid phosphatase
MAADTGIYITWVTGAILISIAMIPIFKPPYAKVSLDGFIDMFRRYWAHMLVVFSVYLWKDVLDGLDRVLMANTQLDMTALVYAIEGDIVLWVQEGLRNDFLDVALTHFYVMGFMTATFASFLYPIYFDDRHMADRVSLSMFWVYLLAIPFYLFLNVRVAGDYIPTMETIAYDLTPEIHNWFNRIDPFTNGMPSLHIGLPFAIWLSMHRWDEDGRWSRYRMFLVLFIILTAFSILYLGIHWIVDIIGGMTIGIMAVNMTARTHEPIWRIADERLFTRRLARILDDPGTSISRTLRSASSLLDPFREPGREQTGAFITALIVLTGSVLLWDATHQNFTINEAESPTSASGSGEWLVGVEEAADEGVSITVWNITSQSNRSVGGDHWAQAPQVITSGSSFVVFGEHRLDYFEHDDGVGVLHPTFSEDSDLPIIDLALGTSQSGETLIVSLTEEGLHLMDSSSQEIEMPTGSINTTVIASSGSLIAWSEPTGTGPVVNITSIESQLTISIPLDPRAEERIEQSLADSGMVFDYNNSTVTDLAMDSHWVVAVVDVGPVNRTVLVNTLSINQTLLSNPRWDSSSPSISNDRVAFLQVTRDDPSAPSGEFARNNDVYVSDLAEGGLIQLTHDEDVDQTQPQVLADGVAWVAHNDDGTVEVIVHSFGEAIDPYSSLLLQASIMMLVPLLFVWAHQSATRKEA